MTDFWRFNLMNVNFVEDFSKPRNAVFVKIMLRLSHFAPFAVQPDLPSDINVDSVDLDNAI